MRVLGATLTAAQKAMGDAVCKIVLTQQGDSTEKTYGVDTTNRILDNSHKESEWSQTAQITVDNRDGNLTALTLEGYTGPISYGYGANYSASAPLTVIAQKTDSLQGDLVTTFSLAGLFDLWGEQKATESYTPEDTNTDTVKTILDAIAGATLDCFSSYPAHTITYDTGYDDSIIDTFTPNDYYSIVKGESRLSAFKKALAYCKDKARVENDAGVATIHIFNPADGVSHYISGTTYNYEYNDAIAAANHNFFDKSVRTRLVLPNRVVVMNHPDHSDTYIGEATDAASYAALGSQYYTETHYVRAASDAQCTLIAAAILQRYQIAAEKGHGFAPMNCGQEVMDYVLITDSRASDTRAGNISYIHRHYKPGKFEMEFRFGREWQILGLAGTAPPKQVKVIVEDREPSVYTSQTEAIAALIESFNSMVDDYNAMRDSVLTVIATTNSIIEYLVGREEVIPKLHVTDQLIIPVKV